MRKVLSFFRAQDKSELVYWFGLILLFCGLCLRDVSLALIVTGAGIALESVVTSYFATWMSK